MLSLMPILSSASRIVLFSLLRNNESRFFNQVWKKHRLGRINAVEDEGAGLRQNSPVAHLGMNIIWHKQIYGVHNWLEIWFFSPDKLKKSFYNAVFIEFLDITGARYISL